MQDSVSALLERIRVGDQAAKDRLYRLVCDELRRIAESKLRSERSDHSLQATILVNEAFLRLTGEGVAIEWRDRAHFMRAAARAMRHVLIDHERKRRARRRGAGIQRNIKIDLDSIAAPLTGVDILGLHDAISRLSVIDPRLAEVVQLRHFGGFTIDETAGLLGVSARTVKTDWQLAKAWLHKELH